MVRPWFLHEEVTGFFDAHHANTHSLKKWASSIAHNVW